MRKTKHWREIKEDAEEALFLLEAEKEAMVQIREGYDQWLSALDERVTLASKGASVYVIVSPSTNGKHDVSVYSDGEVAFAQAKGKPVYRRMVD